MKKEEIVVSILCLAYNHEPYIRQCLDGFVNQKTNFKFEVLIHDDASTDNTADIIREYEEKYPDIIKPIYQTENQYSKNLGIIKTFIFPKIKGKYIAMCEGDDYWIDPLKLQKQVDFLENNPDYGLVYTDQIRFYQTKNRFFKERTYQFNKIDQLILINKIATLTTCFRAKLLEEYILNVEPYLPKLPFGDYSKWLYFLYRTKLYYMPEYTAVYRILEESAYHSKDTNKMLSFFEKTFECRMFFLDRFYSKRKDLIPKIKESYSKEVLHYCVINNKKNDFYRNVSLISYIKDFRFLFLYKLCNINFYIGSYIYSSLVNIRRFVKNILEW